MPGSISQNETADLTSNITNRYKPFNRPYWFGLTASIFGIGAGLPFLVASAGLSTPAFIFSSVLLSFWTFALTTFFWIGPDRYNKRFVEKLRAEDNLTSEKAYEKRTDVYQNAMFAVFGLSLLTTVFLIALLTVYVPGVFFNGMNAVPGEIWFVAAVVALGSFYQMRNCVKNGWGFSDKILKAVEERCVENASDADVEMQEVVVPQALEQDANPPVRHSLEVSEKPAQGDAASLNSRTPLMPG